jgi:predicted nucleic acid-binding protein
MRGARILVPTVVLYEVFKVVCRDVSAEAAREAIASLGEQEVVALDERLALQAADLSLALRLSMADAIVYATAQGYDARLVTCDKHFVGLPGVEYIAPEGD